MNLGNESLQMQSNDNVIQGSVQTPKLQYQHLHIVSAIVATVHIANSMGRISSIFWGVFCEVCGRKEEKGRAVYLHMGNIEIHEVVCTYKDATSLANMALYIFWTNYIYKM